MKVRRLRHPNLALDPPPGRTLAERVRSTGPLTSTETRRLARDLCAGLRHAHAQGIVHGKLDAESVILDGDRWVVFGFAGGADEREDVHGAGAILYTALTGKPPAPGSRGLALPRGFRAQILRSLHERPDRRYGTLEEMARALSVAAPAPPRRPRRWWIPVVAVMIVGLGAAATALALGRRPTKLPAAVAATPTTTAAAAAPAPARRIVSVTPFAASGDAAWLGAGVAEMIATVLAEEPGLEVVGAGGGLVVSGTVDPAAGPAGGGGWVLAARLVDTASAATLAAERVIIARPEDTIGRVNEVAARMAAIVAPGQKPAQLASLTSASTAAWQSYLDGDEPGLRKAIELDPRFFQAHAHLAALLEADGRSDEADAQIAFARPLAASAGAAGLRTLARLAARTPLEKVAALEAERAHAPDDLALTAALASAYRAAGRVADCAAQAERAGAPAVRDLALCRLAAGDGPGALAAASSSEDPVLAGDIALALGKFGEARESYRKAGQRAGARLALVALRAQGKCKTPVRPDSVDDARVAVALAIACGDFGSAHAAAAAIAKISPHASEELAVLVAAARGETGALARAQKRAADPLLWAADGLDRARRYGPIFAAARSEKHGDVLAGFAPAPSDRWGLFEEPLLFDVALAQADLGSAEDAGLACAELAAAGSALALYCQGRVAEAAADWPAAFRAYREFLDRWSDADPDHRLYREATRRSKLAIVKARAPAPPAVAVPAR